MRRALVVAAFLSAPVQASPQEVEKVAVPGKDAAFELVKVAGAKHDGRELAPFWIGKHEVTWGEFSLYYETPKEVKVDGVTRPSQPDVKDPKEAFEGGAEQTPKHPANSIGWYAAMGYCEWLSKRTGRRYRLPTEAEWEAACGPAPAGLDAHAWHAGNSSEQTHEVGSLEPNALGIHDLLGNVWENVLEPFAPPAHGAVLKGGAWNSKAERVGPAVRQEVLEDWLESDPKRPLRVWWVTDGRFIGFRVVRVPDHDAAAAAKIAVENLKVVKKPRKPEWWTTVSGEIVNGGTEALLEVEVTVYYLDEDGKPMSVDPKDKPVYNKVYPVLVNSRHAGEVRQPLAPGGRRKFELEVPHPMVEAGALDLSQVGAKVTGVRVKR
jgi:formylglycine-generating enzyme required for sulfatase activity